MINLRLNSLKLAAAALISLNAAFSIAQTHFSHLNYTTPPNWKAVQNGNWMTLTAQDLPTGQIAVIGISPGGETTRSLQDEFTALVNASKGSYSVLQSQPPKTGVDGQGLPTMQQTFEVQDPSGAKLLRLYIGKKNGSRFEALSLTVSPESVDKIGQAFKEFYQKLAYDGAPAPTQPIGALPATGGGVPQDVPPANGAGGGAQTIATQAGAPAAPMSKNPGAGVKLSKHDKVIGPLAMCVGHDGTIHVAFVEQLSQGIENAVYYRSSSDGGHTWTEAKNLSEVMPTYRVGFVKIAVDASDRVYVIWRTACMPNLNVEGTSHTMNLSNNIVYRVLSGGSWNGTALNVNPFADAGHQDMGAGSFFADSDPAGKVHVAYVLSTDIFHKNYMLGAQHQFKMGNGSVAQVDLDGAAHTAPKEIFMAKVTDDGNWKSCDGLDLLSGYFDSSGSAHFAALATSNGQPDGANRIDIIEGGKQSPGIVLPGPGYSIWSPPPTLLLDAQGRKHLIVSYEAGEQHGIRDYLVGADSEPKVICPATAVLGSILGFQACQGANGQMIALMEMNDTGARPGGDLFISTSAGNGWTTPMRVTDNAAKATGTNAVTGPRSSVVTVTH